MNNTFSLTEIQYFLRVRQFLKIIRYFKNFFKKSIDKVKSSRYNNANDNDYR